MIEKIVLDYLSAQIGYPCYMEVPDQPDEEYVVISKTGSNRENHIDRATLAIKSCSRKSLLRAAEINEEVKAAMDGIVELPDVSRSALNSDYNYTDTDTKTYRYQAVYDLTY